MPQAAGYVTFTLEAYKEGRSFVSRCVELDVASCGDTLEDALEAVKEATTTYLNAIELLGERARIFEEKGIVIHSKRPRAADPVDTLRGATRTLVIPMPRAA